MGGDSEGYTHRPSLVVVAESPHVSESRCLMVRVKDENKAGGGTAPAAASQLIRAILLVDLPMGLEQVEERPIGLRAVPSIDLGLDDASPLGKVVDAGDERQTVIVGAPAHHERDSRGGARFHLDERESGQLLHAHHGDRGHRAARDGLHGRCVALQSLHQRHAHRQAFAGEVTGA